MAATICIKNCGFADNDAKLDFDFEDDDELSSPNSPANREQELQGTLLRAMQKPAVREQIGQVIPILRAMSSQQRLTLAALVSAQIMSPKHADQQNIIQVASMFGAPGESTRNVSEKLLLPISMDIANMFRGIAGDAGRSWRSAPPPWERKKGTTQQRPKFSAATIPPTAQTYNFTVSKGSVWKSQSTTSGPNEINRRNDIEEEEEETQNSSDCEYFTSEMCLEVAHYPEAEIMVSIQKQRPLMESFLSEFGDVHNEGESMPRIQRRRDGGNDLGSGEGYMCPSTVKYAKPKRARTTSGLWKYVVNTGEYTQTLRLEMCTKPGASCSYLNDNFRSVCNQVFNYHRLMTWDEKRGLHMDVFKVPSCCSCHVQGYAGRLPSNDYPFADKRKEVIPIQSSSSGVKREIPRPGRPGGSSQYQNVNSHSPAKKFNQQPNDFTIEQSVSEYFQYPPPSAHTNSPTIPIDPFSNFELQPTSPNPFHHQNQKYHIQQQQLLQQQQHQQQQIQQQQSHHAPIGPPKLKQQLPQYPASNFNHNRQQNLPKNPIQPTNVIPQRQPFGDTQGSGSIQNSIRSPVGLVDHLVPPGPPLPLENERKPNDHRKRNMTVNRQQDGHLAGDAHYSNRNQFNKDKEMPSLPTMNEPMHVRPNRPSNRPMDHQRPTLQQSQGNNRIPFKPTENTMFGSKIRPKPPQRPVFVTPTPLTDENNADVGNAIKVTPKPSKKFPAHTSKINYNYHPIIDFFAKEQQLADRQFHVQPTRTSHRNPMDVHYEPRVHQQQSVTENRRRGQMPSQQEDKHHHDVRGSSLERKHHEMEEAKNQQSTLVNSMPDISILHQRVQSDHEWTPMV